MSFGLDYFLFHFRGTIELEDLNSVFFSLNSQYHSKFSFFIYHVEKPLSFAPELDYVQYYSFVETQVVEFVPCPGVARNHICCRFHV